MVLAKKIGFFTIIILFSLAISIVAFLFEYTDPFDFSIRLFALNGFIALSIATIMTPFLKEIILFFKKPFTRVHHYFAAAGLVLITLHPIVLAVQMLNPSVFLPNVGSLYLFMFYGGRQALIIIYIALLSVFIRRRITAYWRSLHALMYVALFFGIVHANLSGHDFQNIVIVVIFDSLFAVAMVAFGLKRLQVYRRKVSKKKADSAPATNNTG
jgi:DMSO/TMAO reductase YedYZ heme-binding membrane subunit